MMQNKKRYLAIFLIALFTSFCFRLDIHKENLSTLTETFSGYAFVLLFAVLMGFYAYIGARGYFRHSYLLIIASLLMAGFPYYQSWENIHVFCGYLGFSLFSIITILTVEEYTRRYPEMSFLKIINRLIFLLLGFLWMRYLVINLLMEGVYFVYLLYVYQKI